MTREELQNESVSLIDKKRVAIQWATGLGKTKLTIDMINHINKKDIKILLIVAEIAHKNNWKDEFNKWNNTNSNITIECYASLKNYKDTKWDLIIFDEAHHLSSDIRLNILNYIKSEYIILLSATLPDHILYELSNIFGEFIVSKISLKQAIEWDILPKPKIFLIPLELNNIDINCTIIEEWGLQNKRITYKCLFKDRWNYLRYRNKYPNTRLEISCTEQQKYNYLSEQFEYWKTQYMRTRQEYIKNKWLQTGSKRKRFLGDLKTAYAKILLQKLKNKKFICFCSSIEQAELLGHKYAIHSKKTNFLDIIDNFNDNQSDKLFAVGMLQEGQNLNGIECGIIIQLDGQERAFIQKFGRSLRAEDPEQYIFYYKNTRDEEYLNKILEDIDKQYINKINL